MTTTAQQKWQQVYKRSPQARQKLAKALSQFLQTLDNPHAFALVGRVHKLPCDQASAQALEAWVVSEFRKGKITKLDATEWLRLLLDLIYEFNKEDCDLFPTRLADSMRPVKSPFSPSAMQSRQRVEQWRDLLHKWISTSSSCTSTSEWQAAIAVSAVLHGALIDTNKLNQLMDKLGKRVAPAVENGISNYAFGMPFQGLGNHHLQRWFLDPVTEMLMWRYLKMPESKGDLTLQEKLQSFFAKNGLAKLQTPKNPADFVKTSVTWWSERASSLDILCATRTLTSHAVHERTWARIHGDVYDPRQSIKTKRANQAKDSTEEIQLDDLLLLNPWLAESLEIVKGNDITTIKSQIERLLINEKNGATSHIFMNWLVALLDGFSATKEGLALSTIRLRYCATAPRLLAILGELVPAQMSTMELEDCYCELTIDTDPAVPIRDLANGLRDFHAFLHRDYKKPLMRKEADVFGAENSLKPVDANFITFDEYLAAQLWLDRKRMNKNERHIAKLVLMMAFRLGMRRMEIFGLQLRDIQVIDGLVCIVRRNSKRRLKTTSSQRILPLRAFLTKQEQCLLLDWLEQRRNELPPPTSTFDTTFNFVFPKIEDEKFATWVDHMTDAVCAAVRGVTGDQSLFLHHLRHAFGTWTYLRLRAPDFPEVARHFVDSPATVHALRTGIRLRVLLVGRRVKISRTYGYVVSRLMGHSSPVVSLGHYIHVADLLLGEIARREAEKIPRKIILTSSGLQKTSAFENLADSVEKLLLASRNFFFVPTNIESKLNVVKKKIGRPQKTPSYLLKSWLPLQKVQEVLMLSVQDKASSHDISGALGIEESRVFTLLKNAKTFAPLAGLKLDSHGNLIQFLSPIVGTEAIEFSMDLESRISDMSNRAPLLLLKGIHLHFDHLNNDVSDVLFRGSKHLTEIRRYLKFLSSLGFEPDQFSWLLRSLDKSNIELPSWAENLDAVWHPSKIKIIRPKNTKEAKYYQEWLGVIPVDKNGDSLAIAMKKTLFLAKIS